MYPPLIFIMIFTASNSGSSLSVVDGVVTKSASSTDLQDGARLRSQALKQQQAHDMLKYVPNIHVPEVHSISDRSDGLVDVDMAYIPQPNLTELLPTISAEDTKWMSESILDFVDILIGNERIAWASFHDVLPKFREKASQTLANMRKMMYSSERINNVDAILSGTISHIQATDLCDVVIPIGFCHGDLNFSNILVHREEKKLYVIDFLDSFVESPLQDLAALRQDTTFGWFALKLGVRNEDTVRTRQFMSFLEGEICKKFRSEKWFAFVDIFLLWKLVRILPYLDIKTSTASVIIDYMQSLAKSIKRGRVDAPLMATEITGMESLERGTAFDNPFTEECSANPSNVETDTKSITLLLPAAESFDRRHQDRPHWLFIMPSSEIMLIEALSQLDCDKVVQIVVGIRREDLNKFCNGDPNAFYFCFRKSKFRKKVKLVLIEHDTQDQVETLNIMISVAAVRGHIYIKDCDCSFDFKIAVGNYVSVLQINDENAKDIYDAHKKSYVTFRRNPNGTGNPIIQNIKEKVIISDTFCVGGYSFNDASHFQRICAQLRETVKSLPCSNKTSRITVSDCVWADCVNGNVYEIFYVQNFCDWGSVRAYNQYVETFQTVLINLDSFYISNDDKYLTPYILPTASDLKFDTVERLRKLRSTGRVHIVLLTSRSNADELAIRHELMVGDVPFNDIVFNVPVARVIYND